MGERPLAGHRGAPDVAATADTSSQVIRDEPACRVAFRLVKLRLRSSVAMTAWPAA